jgi:LacI family transcriptional regulator
MNKRPTISDVARLAHVSRSTVSHVLNNTRFVEEDTRCRVMDAVDSLGDLPSAVARSLATQRTGTIGMIVADASNYFFGEMLRGVEDILHPAQYSLAICNTDEVLERESHYLSLLLRHRVDGIVAAATSQQWSALQYAEMQHTPVVFVDRRFSSLSGLFVGVDNAGGAYLGTRHLIEKGHRRLGILAGFARLSTMREREAGFRRALDEAGLPVREEWIIRSPLSIEGGKQAIDELLALPEVPDAIFVNNNLLTLGALLVLKERKVRTPEDLALVGFDDHPWAAVTDPPLTVVRQPIRELGQVAARLLIEALTGAGPREMSHVLACELIVRQSC